MKKPAFNTSLALQEGTLTTQAGVIRWWQCGSGQPLLMFNGGPGSPSAYMHPLVQHFGQRARAIIFDQPGTGGSPVATLSGATVGIEAILRAAEALRTHLQIERWHVFGHSFGTLLGTYYAAAHPERVASLVLSGPAGPDISYFGYFRDNVRVRLNPAQRARLGDLLALSKSGQISAEQELELDALFAHASVFDPQWLDEGPSPMEARINRATSEVVWASLQDPPFDLKPRLSAVTCPAIVLAGRQDYVGEAAPLAIAAGIAQARLVWFDQCGHKPWVEKLPEFDQALDTFFESIQA